MSRADYDAVVVGSGPGGAVTARTLGEAGLRVLVVEEGDWVPPGTHDQFSLAQMGSQYRNRGLTVALGRPSVAYTEGCGVGGGSEINSGLYHRPPASLLAGWSERWAVEGLSAADLGPHCRAVEDELLVREAAGADPPSSVALRRGAQRLGWRCERVPRWVSGWTGPTPVERRTMSATYWPAALAAGVQLRTGVRASRLELAGGRVTGVRLEDVRTGRSSTVRVGHVVVCGGAVQTPALLQRSGLRRNIGRRLALHPTVKVVAEFPDEVNPPHDVPAEQVREFAPRFTLGGSASTPGLVALALSENWPAFDAAARRWRRCFVYYAAVLGHGRGRVRAVPGFAAPLVTYRLTGAELTLLREGLARLLEVLRHAGARSLYPSVTGAPHVRTAEDDAAAVRALTRSTANLMTVHLCGSVPMGEDRSRCGADSFGRVHGTANLRVADASLLPTAPGINPQGTVMAIAARNAAHFLAAG